MLLRSTVVTIPIVDLFMLVIHSLTQRIVTASRFATIMIITVGIGTIAVIGMLILDFAVMVMLFVTIPGLLGYHGSSLYHEVLFVNITTMIMTALLCS